MSSINDSFNDVSITRTLYDKFVILVNQTSYKVIYFLFPQGNLLSIILI